MAYPPQGAFLEEDLDVVSGMGYSCSLNEAETIMNVSYMIGSI